jgi:hypothetical protein
MVAHLTPTPYFLIALAASMVTWSLVRRGFDAEVVILEVDVEIGQDQLVLDEVPDDPGHLVAVEFDDRVGYLDLRHVSACRSFGWSIRAMAGRMRRQEHRRAGPTM